MSAPCAAASATPAGLGCLRHRRLRLGRRALSQLRPASTSRKSISTSGPAGPPAPAWNTPSRRTGACRLEYLYSQFERANVRFPSGAQYNSTLDFQQLRIGLNRKVDWPGSTSWTPKTDLTDPESDRWEIHGQTTYLGAGLSGVPRALYRHQQPDARAAGAGHLEQQPLSERPALGRRRGLLQSRTAAGLWPQRHRRHRRISQRRGAEVELPLPALQHLAAVCAPDLRLRRRAGRTCQRRSSSSRARSTSTG